MNKDTNIIDEKMKKLTSKRGKLLSRDYWQSLLMATITSLTVGLVTSLSNLQGEFDFKTVCISAVAAAASHLLRKYLQNEDGDIINKP